MIAIVRISPTQPTAGTPPYFGKDKLTMVRSCLKSLLKAGKCKKIFLLDNCPEWEEYFAPHGQIFHGVWGKRGSLFTAYEVGKNFTTEPLLFLEDDYLWREDTLATFEDALNNFGFMSPYNHPDVYTPNEKAITENYIYKGLTYRHCQTNTHTFGVRADIFAKHYEDFKYGMHDWQMWFYLGTQGVRGYCPNLSFATHLVKDKLAYDVNWERLIKKNWEGKK